MNIVKATARYEAWLGSEIELIQQDLDQKHELMRADAFSFFRATFYRWMQLWPEVCGSERRVPVVLAVGDLHVENYGTWRDGEGRLVWGVNDFDEAHPLPYTQDLIRLATSAHLAIQSAKLAVAAKDACDTILNGYADALAVGGKPWVLAERHVWLRELATEKLKDPKRYWSKLDALCEVTPPSSARKALANALPGGVKARFVHREAGLGSRGRQRYAAVGEWKGGRVAREAKALATSACLWAQRGKGRSAVAYEEIVNRAVRCEDPFLALRGSWLLRRLAPDCARVELADLPKSDQEIPMLRAMGAELANVHLGSKKAVKAVAANLQKRRAGWLHKAAGNMLKATMADFEEWKAASV